MRKWKPESIISGDNIYQFLLYFDKLYDKFTDAEKKEFLNSFIERVDIYEQEQPDGRFLKHIKFRFPVYFNGKEIEEMSWDNETTVETLLQSQTRISRGTLRESNVQISWKAFFCINSSDFMI